MLENNANSRDLIPWMAYKEARALIQFEPAPASRRRPTGNDRATGIRPASRVTCSSASHDERTCVGRCENEGSDSGFNGRADLAVRHRTDIVPLDVVTGKLDETAKWRKGREAGNEVEKKPVKP
jgi:hypothetical protein